MIRSSALVFLMGAICAQPRPDIAALRAQCHDASPETRAAAAGALGRLGSRGASAVPDLIGLVSDDRLAVQRAGERALSQIVGEDQSSLAAVFAASFRARGASALALREVIPKAGERAVPFLIKEATRETRPAAERYGALDLLGDIGPRARSAVKPLTKMLSSPDHQLAVKVAGALARIEPGFQPAIRRLVQALDDKDNAIVAAAYLVPTAQRARAVPILGHAVRRAFQDRHSPNAGDIFAGLAWTMARIGPAARKEAPALRCYMRALQEEGSKALAVFAAGALLQIEPGDKEARRCLKNRLGTLVDVVRSADDWEFAYAEDWTCAFALKILDQLGLDAQGAIRGLEMEQSRAVGRKREAISKVLRHIQGMAK